MANELHSGGVKSLGVNMLRIGEFAVLCSVSIKTLRYYDQIGLFKPEVVNPDNGYRYYRKQSAEKLQLILVLKDLGVSLEQIAAYMQQEESAEACIKLLTMAKKRIENDIELFAAKLEICETMLTMHKSDPSAFVANCQRMRERILREKSIRQELGGIEIAEALRREQRNSGTK